MELIITFLIGIIAFLHCYILWFEMFAWTTAGRKLFRKYPAEFFEKKKCWLPIKGYIMAF